MESPRNNDSRKHDDEDDDEAPVLIYEEIEENDVSAEQNFTDQEMEIENFDDSIFHEDEATTEEPFNVPAKILTNKVTKAIISSPNGFLSVEDIVEYVSQRFQYSGNKARLKTLVQNTLIDNRDRFMSLTTTNEHPFQSGPWTLKPQAAIEFSMLEKNASKKPKNCQVEVQKNSTMLTDEKLLNKAVVVAKRSSTLDNWGSKAKVAKVETNTVVMSFAVVTLPEEDDALGIIPTKWITGTGKTCLYPPVASDFTREKLVKAQQKPGNDWKEFKITVLDMYDNYEKAWSHLTEYKEMTANLESELGMQVEKNAGGKNKIIPPSEESSSSGEGGSMTTHLSSSKPSLPKPPRLTHFQSFNNSQQDRGTQNTGVTPQRNSKLKKTFQNSSNTSAKTTSFNKSTFSPLPLLILTTNSDSPVNSQFVNEGTPTRTPLVTSPEPTSSSSGISSSLSSNIETLKTNQELIWGVLGQFSQKLDTILDTVTRIENSARSDTLEYNSSDNEIVSKLPLDSEGFMQFDEMIKEPSFRETMFRLLLNISSGSTVKVLCRSILRRLMTDAVAEEYSMTGKIFGKVNKKAFIKCNTFLLICEICFRKFNNCDESQVKEGISDWLMQAKFRRLRRHKRSTDSEMTPRSESGFSDG